MKAPTSSQLRAALSELARDGQEHSVWRAVRPAYGLTSTRGSRLNGGRWNPKGLGALYASLNPRTVRAESARMAERRGLPERARYPLLVGQFELTATTADLNGTDALERIGLVDPVSILTPVAQTQRIGAAAAKAGIGALLVPSVAADGTNLVVFPEHLDEEPVLVRSVTVRTPGRFPTGD